MKQETIDHIIDNTYGKFDELLTALFTSFGINGLNASSIGLDRSFMEAVVVDIYCEIFTEEEIEEMVAFDKKYAKRREILEQLVSAKMEKVMAARRGDIERIVAEALGGK